MESGVNGTWAELSSAVTGGELYLEPDVARRCAERCDVLLDELRSIRVDAQRLSIMEGLGNLLPSGVALASKFEKKAAGADDSLDRVLDKHMSVVAQMRDLFSKIDAQYRATEDSNQQALGNTGASLTAAE